MRVHVALGGGSAVEFAAVHAPGDPERPLDRAGIEENLRRAARSGGIAADADELIDRLRTFAEAPSVAPLVRSLRAEPAQ